MKLTEFRELIEKVHEKALNGEDPAEAKLAQAMSPAEYFAYDAVRMVKYELQSRIERESDVMESLFHPENNGYSEAEYAHTVMSDILELIDAYLSGIDVREWDDPLTPDPVDIEMELDAGE